MTELVHDRVTWELDDGLATIILARPEAGNAFDTAMAHGLLEVATRAESGSRAGDVRAIVIAAQGSAFSVGGDLQQLGGSGDRAAEMERIAGTLHRALRLLADCEAPIISAVQGVAAGGGMGLALSADVVLAAPQAKFRMAYTAVGLSPDCGTTWVLPRVVGQARALDLALTNRVLTAEEAADWGLVSRVVHDDLPAAAAALGQQLALGAGSALRATKRLLRSSLGSSLVEQLDREEASVTSLIVSADGVEGVDAFLGRRRPDFA